jgi:hypothetical protein
MPKVVREKIESVNRIISAKDYGGVIEYFESARKSIIKNRGIAIEINYDNISSNSVKARVWQGQWIADCECGGASFVEAENPIFFCFSCGNRANNGWVRHVDFPKDRLTIENLLLDRPVDDTAGLTDKERVGLSKPVIFIEGKGGLSRNWNPDEDVLELAEQNKTIKLWKDKVK